MKDKRTLQQNKALWLFYERLATTLNEAGYDMKRTLSPQIDIPWNKQTVHDYLWLPVQEAQLQKDSTTELDRKEINLIYETLNRFLGERLSINIPFPSIEDIIIEEKK